ncbi:hypothetical protein, partial [Acidithiobacillus ferrooxidans]|uniref:hypothetical protein n=1 Tax=Acidithiobacillus ferrooxidans TaxID=920 RepID=UPI001D033034
MRQKLKREAYCILKSRKTASGLARVVFPMPLPTTGTPGGPGFFGKGFINAVQHLKYFGIMQKVMAHLARSFSWSKVTLPQQARLFKFFEGVY